MTYVDPATTALPFVTDWTPIPSARKGVVTAPPSTSGIVLVNISLNVVLTSDAAVRVGLSGPDTVISVSEAEGVAGPVPVALVGLWPVAAGSDFEVVPVYTYVGSSPASPAEVTPVSTDVLFLPGGVVAGTVGVTSPVQYWDGTEWVPGEVPTADVDTGQDADAPPVVKTSTTTEVTTEPTTAAADSTVRLVATVDPPEAAGTVTFFLGPLASGPWTKVGSAQLDEGSAAKLWLAQTGTYFARAVYGGSRTHLSSEDVSGAMVVGAEDDTTGDGAVIELAATGSQAGQFLVTYDGRTVLISDWGGDVVYQGPPAGDDNTTNISTLVWFDLAGLPALADINQVELVCSDWATWDNLGGGSLVVGWHEQDGPVAVDVGEVPGDPVNGWHPDLSEHEVETGAWSVGLPWADLVVGTAAFKGLVIGPGFSSEEYHGDSGAPAAEVFKLRVTYEETVSGGSGGTGGGGGSGGGGGGTAPPAGPLTAAIMSTPGLIHFWPLASDATDAVGSLHGTVHGSVTYGPKGAVFDGSSYIEIADSNDLSLANQASHEMTIVAVMAVDDWAEGSRGDPNGYVHWMGKSEGHQNEWKARHYFDPDTSGESPARTRRVSCYFFPLDGGLGSGSYAQDTDSTVDEGHENLFCFTFDSYSGGGSFPGKVEHWKNGVLRDSDPFDDYDVVPQNSTTPMRLGTADLASFFVGTLRCVCIYNRKLSPSEIASIYAASTG